MMTWCSSSRRALLVVGIVLSIVAADAPAATKTRKTTKKKTAATETHPDKAPKTKKKNPKDALARSEDNEYTMLCSACYRMAHHAHRSLRFNVERGVAPTADGWRNVLRAGCAAPMAAHYTERDMQSEDLCRALLVDKFGGLMAQELGDLVDDAGGDPADSSIADPDRVVETLCGPDSITRACPSTFRVHAKPLKQKDAARLPAEVSFWNSAGVAIEIHLITSDDDPAVCARSELEEDSPMVRVVEPNKEKVIAVGTETADEFLGGKTAAAAEGDVVAEAADEASSASAAPPIRPVVRVKPRGAPCGAGFDVVVDPNVAYSLYRVLDAGVYSRIVTQHGDAEDDSFPQPRDDAPLVAVRLFHNDKHDDLFSGTKGAPPEL